MLFALLLSFFEVWQQWGVSEEWFGRLGKGVNTKRTLNER